jgi:hypothetical protein
MLGVDVRRVLRVPKWTTTSAERRNHTAKMIAKQSSITSRYGVYSGHRVLHEARPDKREQLLGAPAVTRSDPTGDVIGSWVVVGPTADDLSPHLEDLDEHLELQSDGEHFAPFKIGVDVRDGDRRAAFATAASRLCAFKNIEDTRAAISVLQMLAGDPVTAAIALGTLGSEDDGDRSALEVYEVRSALRRAVHFDDIGSEHVLPEFTSVVSAVVVALLDATEPLSTSAVAEAAGVTTAGMRTETTADQFDMLEAIGLLERVDQGSGQATLWRLAIPFENERSNGQPVPTVTPNTLANRVSERRVTDTLAESIYRYVDDVGAEFDQPVIGTEDALAAFAGQPFDRDLRPLVERCPQIRDFAHLVAHLLDEDLELVFRDGHTSDVMVTVELGQDPSPETTQASVEAAVTMSD